jgi:hypothetical protein
MQITIQDYLQHYKSLINKIEDIISNDPDTYEDIHKAFNFLVAELFADSTNEEHYFLTDGSKDQGIDFYTKVQESYEVFQCKIPELKTLEKLKKPNPWDDKAVDDIENAYKYLDLPPFLRTLN